LRFEGAGQKISPSMISAMAPYIASAALGVYQFKRSFQQGSGDVHSVTYGRPEATESFYCLLHIPSPVSSVLKPYIARVERFVLFLAALDPSGITTGQRLAEVTLLPVRLVRDEKVLWEETGEGTITRGWVQASCLTSKVIHCISDSGSNQFISYVAISRTLRGKPLL
jgi:hypothetical protein